MADELGSVTPAGRELAGTVLDAFTIYGQDGKPYELTRFVMRADLTGLAYDTPIE
jgi:hypothetical protein